MEIQGVILKRSVRNIRRIILHCTATPEGKDFTVEDIRRWHRQRGFSDIGYHSVIYRDGSLHVGRDVNVSGAHTEGYNTSSIGIVYVGGLTADGSVSKDTRTEAQIETMHKLVAELKKMYPDATVHGHREFAKKDCPSFDVRKVVWLLLVAILISCHTTHDTTLTESRTRIEETEDTVREKIVLFKELNTIIREAGSVDLAKFGITIPEGQKAFLIQQSVKEKEESRDERIVYRTKEVHDSIPYPVYIDRPVEVRQPPDKRKYFWWGVGVSLISGILIVFRKKIATFLKFFWLLLK